MFSAWRAVRSSERARSLPTPCSPFFVSVLILATLLGFSGLAQSAGVNLEWDPVTDPRVAMYEVHWGGSSGQYEGSVASAATSAEIAGLQEGETYFFGARACTEDRATCSAFSEEVVTTLPFAQPLAGFSVASPSGVAPHAVVFTDTSSGAIESRAWDFGDGATSTAPAPTHTYTSPGSYTVSLTVDGPGGSATATMTDVVSVAAAPPVADFSASKTAGMAPLTITFTDVSSGDINAHEWNFGDGTQTTGAMAVHTFTAVGTYTVSLAVTGPGGTATETKQDLVSVVSPPPVADFNTSESVGPAPLTVDFMNTSSGDVTGYHWDFGDGGASTEANPDHSYSIPGQYDVMLTVSGPGGSDTLTKAGHVEVTGDEAIIEVGEIVLDHEWQRVDFERSFVDPVVIVKPISGNDDDAAVVRLDGLDSGGFRVRVQEWDYLDGIHDEETVSYMVIERGRHQLAGGAWIEADRVDIGSDQAFVATAFEAPFASTPVVLTTVTTNNETDAVTTRLRNIDEYGFELGLQEQEANLQEHAPETIAYVAWEPSSGEIEGMRYEVGHAENRVRHIRYTIAYSAALNLPPVFLADMQTTNGRETANLRWDNKGVASVDVWVDEEQSLDSEIRHRKEVVGYLIVDDLIGVGN